ncbi:MAG: NAD(P)-dependent oxidoreductase [bacterium]|nr:NAD(P)-dependent oxidoreductase [bacterium]
MVVLLYASIAMGKALVPFIEKEHELYFFDCEKHDLLDHVFLAVLLNDIKPDVFINGAEYSSHDEAEYWREHVYKINGFAVGAVADVCKEHAVLFVQLSTSLVFDGKKDVPYTEEDLPGPGLVYGDSKLLGETKLAESGCPFLIVRVPELYGPGFSFVQSVLETAKRENRVRVVKDEFISPVNSVDFAESLTFLINAKATGIFHITQTGYARTSEFFAEAVSVYNAINSQQLECVFEEYDYREVPAIADRPLFRVLDNSKFREFSGKEVRDWKSALEDYIRINT